MKVVFGGSGDDGVKTRARPAPSPEGGSPGNGMTDTVPPTDGVSEMRSASAVAGSIGSSKIAPIAVVVAMPAVPAAGSNAGSLKVF